MTKKALLVGINYKKNEELKVSGNSELSGCINDVTNVKKVLMENFDYHEDNIKFMTDDTCIKPTKKNIEEALCWLVNDNCPGDTLVFHYSGHGSNQADTNRDESDSKDESLCPLDFETAGMFVDDCIFEYIKKVQKDVTLYCFSDSCHSGTVFDLKYNYRSLCVPIIPPIPPKTPDKNLPVLYHPEEWTSNFDFSIEHSKKVKGNIISFSGCLDSETSADAYLDNVAQGAFTFCLLKFFQRNLCDGKIENIKNLYVLKQLVANLDMYGFSDQNSQLSVSDNSLVVSYFSL